MKKILLTLLSFLMVLSILGMASATDYNVTNWTTLDAMRYDLAGDYTLLNDLTIEMDDYDTYASSKANGGEGWLPLGNSTTKFTGDLNGNKKVIEGLYINRPSDSYQGLVGYATGSNNISYLGLKDVNITGSSNTGGVIGNCQTCSGNALEYIYVTGEVNGGTATGGIYGQMATSTNVNYMWSSANVNGGTNVGGLFGSSSSGQNRYDMYYTGNVTGTTNVGGISGSQGFGNSLYNTFVTGRVVGTTSDGNIVGNIAYGGIFGARYRWVSPPTGACYGTAFSASLTNCALQTPTSAYYRYSNYPMSAWDFTNIWDASLFDLSYPHFIWENYTGDVYVNDISWQTTGGFTDSDLVWNQIIDEINATIISDGYVGASTDSVWITVTDPDDVVVIDKAPLTNSTTTDFNYSSAFTLNKVGIWEINMSANNSNGVVESTYQEFNVTIPTQSLIDGHFGYDPQSVPSNSTIDDLATYSFDIIEIVVNASEIDTKWVDILTASIRLNGINTRAGLKVLLDYNLTNDSASRDLLLSNISANFGDLSGEPHLNTFEYIKFDINQSAGHPDTNITVDNLNIIAFNTTITTGNDFVVYSNYNSTTLDDDYIQYADDLIYLTATDESDLINNLANLTRTQTSKSRMYYDISNPLKSIAQTYHETIITSITDSPNISTAITQELVSELDNGNILVYNNQSTTQNFTYDLTTATSLVGKDIWDYTNSWMEENDSDGTITFYDVAPYSAILVTPVDVDRAVIGEPITIFGAIENILSIFKPYTSRTHGSTTGANARAVELWDARYTPANTMVYYGWLNSTEINNPAQFNNLTYLVIADKNDAEIDTLSSGTNGVLVFGYIYTGDYSEDGTNNYTWVDLKKGEVDTWTDFNESMNIFLDGLDYAYDQDQALFLADMKNVTDYIKTTKGREVGVNIFTNYQSFAQLSSANGFAMKESCTRKWMYENELVLDGDGDYVSVADSTSLNTFSNLSVSAWVNFRETTSSQVIVSKDEVGKRQYTMDLAGGKARFYVIGGGGSNQIVSTASLSPDTWYQITGMWNSNGTLSLYIDGAEASTPVTGSPTSIATTTANVGIGWRDYVGNYNYVNGSIDEVQIYDVVLTEEHILDHYNANRSRDEEHGVGLISYWDFDEALGVRDISNGNDGTLNGNAYISTNTDTFDYADQFFLDTGLGYGDYNKSIWYNQQNVNLVCVSFMDRPEAHNPTTNDYMLQERSFLKASVLGYENFAVTTPTFQYVYTDSFYDLGTKLQSAPTVNGDLFSMRYSKGTVFYNHTSDIAWFEDGLTFGSAYVSATVYDASPFNYTFNINGYEYQINTVGGNFYTDYNISLNETVFNNAYGHYEVNVTSTAGGFIGDDRNAGVLDTFGKHSFLDLGSGEWSVEADATGQHTMGIIINVSKSNFIDTTTDLTQSALLERDGIKNFTISTVHDFNEKVITAVDTIVGAFSKVSVFFGGSSYDLVNYEDSVTCLTANPTFLYNEIAGLGQVGVCIDTSEGISFRFEVPQVQEDITFTVDADNFAPTIGVVSPISTNYTTSEVNFTFSFDEPISNWTINYNGTNFTGTDDQTLTIEDGDHSLIVYGADSSNASNIGVSEVVNFTVDTTAPIITVISPTTGEDEKFPPVEFIVNISEDGTCNYSLDGGSNVSMTTSDSRLFINSQTLSTGSHNITYYCTDIWNFTRQSETSYFDVHIISTDTGNGGTTGEDTTEPAVVTTDTGDLHDIRLTSKTWIKGKTNYLKIEMFDRNGEKIDALINVTENEFLFDEKTIREEKGEYNFQAFVQDIDQNNITLEIIVKKDLKTITQEITILLRDENSFDLIKENSLYRLNKLTDWITENKQESIMIAITLILSIVFLAVAISMSKPKK